MKQQDIQLRPPMIKSDPQATRELAAMVGKLQDILRDIYDNIGTVVVDGSAPVASELDEKGNAAGEVRSDIRILDDGTQTNRKLYYKYQGNLRLIDSA